MNKPRRVPQEGRGLAATVLIAALATTILLALSLTGQAQTDRRPGIEWAQTDVVVREAQNVVETRRQAQRSGGSKRVTLWLNPARTGCIQNAMGSEDGGSIPSRRAQITRSET